MEGRAECVKCQSSTIFFCKHAVVKMLIPILFYQIISVLVKICILTLLKYRQMFAGKERFVSLASLKEKSLVLSQQEATNNKFMKKN